MNEQEAEQRAKELALFHGGKMAYAKPGEGMMINAYLTLTREGQWHWPRGLHTGDLLATYIDLHWRDFLDQARAGMVEDKT